MEQHFLSNIELYFSDVPLAGKTIKIEGDEAKHISKVMRHNAGDCLHITNGKGKIFQTEIFFISKSSIECKILKEYKYENEFKNIFVCIPRLRNADRFEFALEKCIELGITNFIIYEAEHSVAKGEKIKRWEKISISAMKQSLRSYKPELKFEKSLNNVINIEGIKIYFDQKGNEKISSRRNQLKQTRQNIFFVFGPEGGFSENEFQLLNLSQCFKLTPNRLRAETAVITAISNFILD